MKNARTLAFIAAALVAGFVLGGVGMSLAAPSAVTAASPYGNVGTADLVTTLARLTGLSAQEIIAQRASGKSFAEIATANGVDPATVVSQTLEARKTYLDGLVSSGRMTQAQEDANLAAIQSHLEAMMSSTAAGIWGPGSFVPSSTPSVVTSGTPGYRGCGPYGPSRPATFTPSPRRVTMPGPQRRPAAVRTPTTRRVSTSTRTSSGTTGARSSYGSAPSPASPSGSRIGYCGSRSGSTYSGGSRTSSGPGSRSGGGPSGCGW